MEKAVFLRLTKNVISNDIAILLSVKKQIRRPSEQRGIRFFAAHNVRKISQVLLTIIKQMTGEGRGRNQGYCNIVNKQNKQTAER